MKKLFLVCTLVLMGSLAFGQINSGSIFLSGMGSISTSGGESTITGGPTTITTEADKNFKGTFGVGGGYFLNQNIALGLNLMFTGSRISPADTVNPEVKSSGLSYGVFARYYVPMGDRFYFHGGLGFKAGSEGSKTIKDGAETDGPTRSFTSTGISPGFTFFPTPKIGLDMTWGFLGYSTGKTESTAGPVTTTVKSNGFDANFDLTTISFGIHYFLQ